MNPPPCPCLWYDHDEGADEPGTCFCGHARDLHEQQPSAGGRTGPGACRAVIDPAAPYDPRLTEAVLRLVERDFGNQC